MIHNKLQHTRPKKLSVRARLKRIASDIATMRAKMKELEAEYEAAPEGEGQEIMDKYDALEQNLKNAEDWRSKLMRKICQ